jgi:predicted RNase H-like nuclease (RuvC/YqgF family)
MDQTKLIQSVVDTAIATSNELLISNIQLKAEIRVYNDMINEHIQYIKELENRVGVLQHNESALNNKAAHMDSALQQLAEANRRTNELQTSLEEKDQEITSLKAELEKSNTVKDMLVKKLDKQTKQEAVKKTKKGGVVETDPQPISLSAKPTSILDDF